MQLSDFAELDLKYKLIVVCACFVAIALVFYYTDYLPNSQANAEISQIYNGNMTVTPAQNTVATGLLTSIDNHAYVIYYNSSSPTYETACQVTIHSK